MRAQKPQAGLAELMAYVDSRRLRKGICTRNFECVLLPSLLSSPFSLLPSSLFPLPSSLFPLPSTYPSIPNRVSPPPSPSIPDPPSSTAPKEANLPLTQPPPQHTGRAPPDDLPAHPHLHAHHHARVPPPEARPGGDPAHRGAVGRRGIQPADGRGQRRRHDGRVPGRGCDGAAG